jgi:predicted acetyltransferase
MTNTSQLDYGPARADEIDTLNGVLEQALTFGAGTMAPWTLALGHDNMRAVRRAGRPVAGIGFISMGHYFGGRSVPAAGITAVGVAPDQRGSGVGLWMLRRSLEELHDQGVPLASLYPATTAFYRRTGFERAAQRTIYELPVAAIGLRDYTLEAAPAGPEDYGTIKQLYAQQGERSAGLIDRPEFYWNLIFTPRDKQAYKFIVRRDGVPEGYVVFLHAGWGDPLQVRDIVALTPAAGRRLLTMLADHRSMIETLRIPGGPSDPLLFLLPEQKHKAAWTLDLMLRLVDVAAALEARGYAPGVAGELHLDVRDDMLPWNQGRLVLSVADGRAQARPGGQGRIQLHARDLAALYSGYLTAAELAAAGTLAGPDADLALASLIFAGPRPWTPDMF